MATIDAMAARLASSLALADGKNPVDLRPSKGLRQPEAFMIGKLLTAKEYSRRSFLGMFRAAWRINGNLRVEEVGEDDRVLFSFTDPNDVDRVWKGGPWGYNRAPIAIAPYDGVNPAVDVPLKKSSYWMTLQGIPPAFRSERIMRLIGSTLEDLKEIDRPAFRNRVMRIRVEIDYVKPLLFRRRFWVEDEVQFVVQFRYDKIFGRCGTCGLVIHVGLPCSGPELVEDNDTPVGAVAPPTALAVMREQTVPNPNVNRVVINNQTLIFKAQVPRSIPEALLPPSVMNMRRQKRQVQIRELLEPRHNENPITGLRRIREDDEVTISPKKLRLSLAIGKKNLDAVNMGLLEGSSNANEPSKRKRGRPIGSVNKLPYGTAGKGKNAKKDGESAKTKSRKTNLMPRLLVADDESETSTSSNPKGKEQVLA